MSGFRKRWDAKRAGAGLAALLALVLACTLGPVGAWAAQPADNEFAQQTLAEGQGASASGGSADVDEQAAETSDEQGGDALGRDNTSDEASSASAPQLSELLRPERAPGVGPLAAGDPPTLNLNVSIDSDGTPDWDADDTAGNDSGPANGIVRVNDTVRYKVEYAVNTNPGHNTTFSITFPRGMEITEVPGFCTDGGSIIPETAIAGLTLPLSAASIDQLTEQKLTCDMGLKENASDTVFVNAKVLNLAHQGQELTPVAATLDTDESIEPLAATNLPTVKASARLKWDISKNAAALTEDSGYVWGPQVQACPGDPSASCFLTSYSVLMGAEGSGKGAMPAIGDVTFIDDLSPEAMYPGLSSAEHAEINGNLEKYGSIARVGSGGISARPGQKIGGMYGEIPRTETNSVRDSGTMSVVQSGPGTPAAVTLSGSDFTLRTYPSQAVQPIGQALPAGKAYAVSLTLAVYTPVAVVQDFGVESNSSWTLKTYNSYTQLSIDGFEATDHQGSADQPGMNATKLPSGVSGPVNWNDYRTTTPNVQLGRGFTKRFVGVPNADGNMAPNEFGSGYPIFEGPPGGATQRSGGIVVAPKQNIVSSLSIYGSDSSLPAVSSVVACDAWDNSLLHLRAADYEASTVAAAQQLPSGGEAVWVSGYNNVPNTQAKSKWATSITEVPELQVQYSAFPDAAAGAASECGDAQGPWYDSPSDAVFGNDPVLADEGVYTGVARVRVHLVLPEPTAATGAGGGGVQAFVSIGMQVARDGVVTEPGTIVPNWASDKRVNFEEATMDEVLAANAGWARSTYNSTDHSGAPGDRLTTTPAFARIDKQVRKGTSGAFSDIPPNVTGGDVVQYRIAPSLTSGAATPGVLKNVWVEDCLPGSQTYSSASPIPTVVSPGSTPGDAKRPACASDETYIRWVIPNHEVNTTIEPIILTVDVSPTADDGTYTNTAVVWAQDDISPLADRTDEAGIQIANVAGVKLQKTALTPLVQLNRPGQAINEQMRWAVKLTNTLPDSPGSALTDPDVIDMLPTQDSGATDYDGALAFVSAVVTDGGATRILYTSAAEVQLDPAHASNGVSGTTAWCDAPSGGAVVLGIGPCPTAAADVTGLRIQRPGEYRNGDMLSIELTMEGTGNSAGDVYENSTFARVTNLLYAVGPIHRRVAVIGSSIGDYFWWDLNRNGAQDQFQGEDEPGVQNATVRLSGKDDLGNDVSLTTPPTQTDSNGNYLFDGLRAAGQGGYTVTFVASGGAEFTTQHAPGVDPGLDSDANASGVSDPVLLEAGVPDDTIDAGLLAQGSLSINKLLSGVGVLPFAGGDTLAFEVVCTLDDEPWGSGLQIVIEVPEGATSVAAEVVDGLPALAECTVTEVAAGDSDADLRPAPVTVTIPWDANAPGTVTASLTNYYSAGSIALTKKLEGDAQAIESVKNTAFEILVTCQVMEEETVATLYSGVVKIKGGQTKMLVDSSGQPRYLPLGARCFGDEVDSGGASKIAIDHDSFENAALVTSGTPEQLQRLQITAVNTFVCTDRLCPKPGEGQLTRTGARLGGYATLAAGLLLVGAALLLIRRRRDRRPESPTELF